MAKAKSKTQKIVDAQMAEVFEHPPSTLKAGQSAEARRKQQVAIGLEKARTAGAKVPRKARKASS
jgi:hypothetical protein